MLKLPRQQYLLAFAVVAACALVLIVISCSWRAEDDNRYYRLAADYIKAQAERESHDRNEQDWQVFVDYHGFGVNRQRSHTDVYVWITDESYYVANDQLHFGSGSSIAYKCVVVDEQIHECQLPKDGSLYANSVKEMFPPLIAAQVLHFQFSNRNLTQQVQAHYAYLPSTQVVYFSEEPDVENNDHNSAF